MSDFDSEDLLAQVRPGVARRMVGVGSLGLLGMVLVSLATTNGMPAPWQAMLAVLALAAFWAAWRMYHATALGIYLTQEGVFRGDGHLLVPVADITGLERGMFAMKPSSGFVILTQSPLERAWAPGLYWAIGRRLGIGGVTNANETKYMAQVLEGMIVARGA